MGLSVGLLGVGWPSIQETFGLPLDAVGVLFVLSTTGHLIASSLNGRLVPRFGAATMVMIGTLLAAIGQIGIALAPEWWVVVAVGVSSGIGVGIIDSGMNIYIAENHSARVMNWAHACFGLGATISPAMMTAIINNDLSWRYGYSFSAVVYLLMAIAIGVTYKSWQKSRVVTEVAEEEEMVTRNGRSVSILALWLSVIFFLVYAGVEGTAGQWSFPLFTEMRGVSVKVAGLWVSIYWGLFTLGRLLFGFVVDHVGAVPLLRTCLIGVAIGTLGLISKDNTISFIGLAIVGFVQAPIFPVLISEAPKRFGKKLASRAIGYQVGAAGLGVATLPALAGVIADSWSLEILGPFLLIASLILIVLHEVILKQVGETAVQK